MIVSKYQEQKYSSRPFLIWNLFSLLCFIFMIFVFLENTKSSNHEITKNTALEINF